MVMKISISKIKTLKCVNKNVHRMCTLLWYMNFAKELFTSIFAVGVKKPKCLIKITINKRMMMIIIHNINNLVHVV